MSEFVFNGKFFKSGENVVGPQSRGLRYGDGLFETMKMLNGRIVNEEDHFERLWKGMEILRFEKATLFTKGNILRLIKKLVEKNGHEKSARIRLNVFRGDGGLYDAVNLSPSFIIETWQLPAASGLLNSNGLVCGLFTEAKKSCDVLANIKHNNYLPYVLAALKAKEEKWNDALLLNQYGRIADSTIANVFLVKNEQIISPALSEGCVAGIVRKKMLEFLSINSYDCRETELTIGNILDADEVFLTNSISNIRWVQSIGSAVYKNSVTSKIYDAFCATI